MSRVKRGVTAHKKHKKILKLTKGHVGVRSKLIRRAKESLLHADQYSYVGRKQRKRQMRRLWIVQLGNAARAEGLSYSKFMAGLKAKNIMLDRKVLADLAINHKEDFKQIISQVK